MPAFFPDGCLFQKKIFKTYKNPLEASLVLIYNSIQTKTQIDQLNNGTMDNQSVHTGEVLPATTVATTGMGVSGAMSREDAFRQACQGTPTNDYGLPVFIYRPDLVPADIFQRSEDDRLGVLQSAMIDIIYDEGFPTFSDGTAFWSCMPFEPDDAYAAFKVYLEMGDKTGVRRLEDLYFDLDAMNGTSATSLLDGAARKAIKDNFVFYNWAARCKAYDLFRVAAHHKLRERRILSITDQHFLKAEALLGKLMSYFEKEDDDGNLKWLEELNPKVAMDMLDKLSKMQRTAVGLSAHGHSAGEGDGGRAANADVSVVLRQIAAGAQDPNAASQSSSEGDLSVLLNDPEMAGMAQELIIKVGEANRK